MVYIMCNALVDSWNRSNHRKQTLFQPFHKTIKVDSIYDLKLEEDLNNQTQALLFVDYVNHTFKTHLTYVFVICLE